MGFDAVNRERSAGTLSKLVSQPIYRDAVINGKFLAGVVTVAVMLTAMLLLITGLGLILIGVVPGAEEILRLFCYLVISVAYVSFWLGLSILLSVIFRSIATSALAAVALWIFFAFFIAFGANTGGQLDLAGGEPAGRRPGHRERQAGQGGQPGLAGGPLLRRHLDHPRPLPQDHPGLGHGRPAGSGSP